MPSKSRYNKITDSKISDPLYKEKTTLSLLKQQFSSVIGLFILLFSVVMILALLTWHIDDPSLSYANGNEVKNLMGRIGANFADFTMQFFGLASVAIVLPVFFWGIFLLTRCKINFVVVRLIFYIISILSFACCFSLLPLVSSWPLRCGFGGIIGDYLDLIISHYSLPLFKQYYRFLALSILLPFSFFATSIASCVLYFKSSDKKQDSIKNSKLNKKSKKIEEEFDYNNIPKDILLDEKDREFYQQKFNQSDIIQEEKISLWQKCTDKLRNLTAKKQNQAVNIEDIIEANINDNEFAFLDPHFPQSTTANNKTAKKSTKTSSRAKLSLNAILEKQPQYNNDSDFELPNLALLDNSAEKKAYNKIDAAFLQRNALKLENVLEEFGVKGKIINVNPGPVVTLYELEPAAGIKSSRIIGLADDIARSMSALSVRVAVVPGRNVIGIELPNSQREMVYLRDILESRQYQDNQYKLALALGKNIAGEPVITDLAKMPHLLVAGTTGSGKSVGINTMILSLLYRLSPEQCRFIMVDPKMLELSVYQGIPHLLTPVVTDPKKAVTALKWAVREMEDRYRKMAKLGVRNIDGYNQRILEMQQKGESFTHIVQTGFDNETGKPIYSNETIELSHLPYIVIIIDEMADLMMVAGKDIECAVQRLAQMARAAGLHVIMATQRPSVDVITGTIKANFPTRISFSVTSKIDSRTILGEQGAEQLLGQGDMLFMMAGGRTQRVHGPFVSDKEVEMVVDHLKSQACPEYKDDVMKEQEETTDSNVEVKLDKNDELYNKAVEVILRDGKVSTSYIQRRLSIGYNKAASLIERMEEEGLISAANHVGKREILVKKD